VIYQRFDFTEIAKRSLGSEWRRRSPEEQKEFVKLFSGLLERAYLDKMKRHMKKEMTMKVIYFLAWLSLIVLLSACAATRGAGDVVQGREALLAGNYQAALGYFQEAEQADPNYIFLRS
jgi:hypothetical protein